MENVTKALNVVFEQLLPLMDFRDDFRRPFLLLPFLVLVCVYLGLGIPIVVFCCFGVVLMKTIFDSSEPFAFGEIYDNRHGRLHRLLERRSPLALPLAILFGLDCLLNAILSAFLFLLLFGGVVPFLFIPQTALEKLFPRFSSNQLRFHCCQCLTQSHCESTYGADFSFENEACQQCRRRDEQWMWVRCTAESDPGDAGCWRRLTREADEVVSGPETQAAVPPLRTGGRFDHAAALDVSGSQLQLPTKLFNDQNLSCLELPKHITAIPVWVLQVYLCHVRKTVKHIKKLNGCFSSINTVV
jgi:hypothetical protein